MTTTTTEMTFRRSEGVESVFFINVKGYEKGTLFIHRNVDKRLGHPDFITVKAVEVQDD